MMKPVLVLLVAATIAMAGPIDSGARPKAQRVVSAAAVKMISDLAYSEILRQALRKGWRYTQLQIESGYRRHFEELKLQLIDQGFTILPGEAGT